MSYFWLVAPRLPLLAVTLALGACTTLTGREHGPPIPTGSTIEVENLIAADRLTLERVRSGALPGGHPGPLPRGETEEVWTTLSEDRCGGPCQMTRYVLATAMPLLVIVAIPVVLTAEVLRPDEPAVSNVPGTQCTRDDASSTGEAAAPPAAWLFDAVADAVAAASEATAPTDRYPAELQEALRSATGTPGNPAAPRARLQAGLWRVELLREPAGDLLLLCSRAVVNVEARSPRHFETCVAGRYCPRIVDTGPDETRRLREAIGALGRTLAERQARGLLGLAVAGG
jgi:hypothetical protein